MAPPTTHNTMAKLFQTEKSRMGQSSFKKDKAEFLQESLTVRKRSLLPIEFDENDDDDDDDEEADNEVDEDYEEK